jgi:hypothetical protein
MASSTAGNINLTISALSDSANRGGPILLCVPPKWYDLALFFFGNYLAHAASVVSASGEPWHETLEVVLLALLLPVSGVVRALPAIFHHAATQRDPVRRAARAGALCMVSRTPTAALAPAEHGAEWWDLGPLQTYRSFLERSGMRIHGSYRLKKGYHLALVPARADVWAPPSRAGASNYALAASPNIAKLLVSLVQTTWALTTLYRAQGDQIEQFGYAAFGLTVSQYAFMSIVNTLGNLLRPEYPSLFIIRTPVMDEAERAGCYFEGELDVVIGKSTSPLASYGVTGFSMAAEFFTGICLGLIPLAIVGWLSDFKAGESTSLERGFSTSWLLISILFGPVGRILHFVMVEAPTNERLLVIACYILVFGVPAIGGMVVVGQMIVKFGICSIIE